VRLRVLGAGLGGKRGRMARRGLTTGCGMLVAVVALTTMAFTASPVSAIGTTVFDGSPGTAAPPSTLGPYTMTPFAPDGRPEFTDVTTVPSPLSGAGSGNLTFSEALNHRIVPGSWLAWSHGYTSDVYCSDCGAPTPGTVTMTLPSQTVAFYFYAESDTFGTFNLTATAQDGTTSGPVSVTTPTGNAKYFGFYTTDPNNPLVSVTITSSSNDMGIGEFGIAGQVPPTPTTTPPAAPTSAVVTAAFTG
jgi:hypothetical protein